MIEALREIVGIIEKLPHIAVWILAGLLLYKICVIGSIYSVVRLCVLKLCEAYSKRLESAAKPKIVDYNLGQFFIRTDDTLKKFVDVVQLFKASSQATRNERFNYVHNADVEWLEDAIKMKMDKNNADT